MKSQVTSLTQAETFLRNRKWVVGSSTNLRDALAFIIQKKPQYILITADHPNKKVRLLPKMLVQAFPIRVIGFAEKGTGNSTKALHEMNLEYNLYPPVSGPAIERMVLKIKKDDELKAQQTFDTSKFGKTDGSGPNNESLILKGDSSADSTRASFEQARAALSQLISDQGTENESSSDGSVDSELAKSGLIMQQNLGGFESGPAYRGGQGAGNSPQHTPIQGQSQAGHRSTEGGPHADMLSARSKDPNGAPLGGPWPQNSNPSSGGNVGNSSSQPGSESQNSNGAPGSSGFHDGNSDWDSTGNSSSLDSSSKNEAESKSDSDDRSTNEKSGSFRKNSKNVPIMESEYVPREKKENYKMHQERSPQGRDRSSIIVRGTNEALEQTVDRLGPDKIQPVQESSNLACITIDSPKFSGYLVCAMGKNRKVDKSLIDLIQKRLFSFLAANGEKMKAEDTMELKIQEVDFSDWALEQAEFLKKSIHDGDEIAMAFFPSKKLTVHLEDSASQKMLKMNLTDIKDDTALEFDLYIFMPQNNKYLLYTPKGRPIYGEQKDRLKDKGVTHMHLRKDSAHQVKKYQAQNFLNEKIAAYKTKASA